MPKPVRTQVRKNACCRRRSNSGWTLLEVWQNDRYFRDRLIRVLSRDIARTRFPRIQTSVIRMSDTKFWLRDPILQFSISNFGTRFEARFSQAFKRGPPFFFFFFFLRIFWPTYRQKFQLNRHNSPPTLKKAPRLKSSAIRWCVPIRSFSPKIAKLSAEKAFIWLSRYLLGWTSSSPTAKTKTCPNKNYAEYRIPERLLSSFGYGEQKNVPEIEWKPTTNGERSFSTINTCLLYTSPSPRD